MSNARQPDAAAAVFGSEPPFFLPPDFSSIEWEIFGRYSNYLAAEIVAGLLESEGLPCIVESAAALPGVGWATILVPKQLMHRGRWIIALGPPGDAELIFLATGELLHMSHPEHVATPKAV